MHSCGICSPHLAARKPRWVVGIRLAPQLIPRLAASWTRSSSRLHDVREVLSGWGEGCVPAAVTTNTPLAASRSIILYDPLLAFLEVRNLQMKARFQNGWMAPYSRGGVLIIGGYLAQRRNRDPLPGTLAPARLPAST